MRCSVLVAFFASEASAANLQQELMGTRVVTGSDICDHRMVDDLANDFEVIPDHLVMLCDAVLEEVLEPRSLEVLAFSMLASDHFVWDSDTGPGQLVAETIQDWSSPEVNFALRSDTIAKFRHRLLSGEDTFTESDADGRPPAGGRVVWSNRKPSS